ncbi:MULTISPECIES: DUF29 domain-containing protein [Cyanophyceae]|uniref:DUF29 domain-containing protein n=1 Tax=Leptolyngbya subtilissima DQ-A4 TaxID=2933933 RepID=A0ABV0KAU8_9CYAN|nr:DUF29 domain-containing protein [Nodosilinea sp. FACHB-141]MBD2110707.1 DUF29 domain-containing protein [Nodosilinea sp. FACHB-141]
MSTFKINSTPTGQAEAVDNLYAADFYAWTQVQAELLRHQAWSQLDLPNLIEEIESLGKQQRQELRNRLSILIGHLLKWHYQPQGRSRSWLATLRIQRLDIADLLDDNPSLKPYLTEALGKAYLKGIELASGETNLPIRTFPSQCSYSLTEILDAKFFPGEPSELIAEDN